MSGLPVKFAGKALHLYVVRFMIQAAPPEAWPTLVPAGTCVSDSSERSHPALAALPRPVLDWSWTYSAV